MIHMAHLLEVNKINVFYGKVQALWDFSMYADEGEIVSVLGGNGAGKSTLMNALSGIKRPASGTVLLDNKRIDNESPSKIVGLRLVQVPEGKKIFRRMSVLENLELGGYTNRTMRNDLESVFRLFPVLKERLKQSAGLLSGGEQQMLAIARALMARPRILMLDEVSAGLAPRIVSEIFQAIKEINREGMTILLVEQNIRAALAIAQRGYILETGRLRFSGSAEELANSDLVREAYLGI